MYITLNFTTESLVVTDRKVYRPESFFVFCKVADEAGVRVCPDCKLRHIGGVFDAPSDHAIEMLPYPSRLTPQHQTRTST